MTANLQTSVQEQNIQSLLDQLAYLVDEISAQVVFIERMPEAIMLAAPFFGTLSIRDRYLAFLKREEHLNRRIIAGLIEGTLVGKEIDTLSESSNEYENTESLSVMQIIERISSIREEVVGLLGSVGEAEWSREVLENGQAVDLRTWAYRMVLQDADDLREIGIQFSEQRFTFSDGN